MIIIDILDIYLVYKDIFDVMKFPLKQEDSLSIAQKTPMVIRTIIYLI